MPSRKQRRRREKTFRHEYEIVDIDAEGNEVPLDPTELRAQREARAKERAPATKSAPPQAQSGRRSRATREPPRPSWRRAFRRGGAMGAAMFVLVVFILRGGSPASRAITGAFYAIAFIPMIYWMDRLAYRMYQRRQAKPEAAKAADGGKSRPSRAAKGN